MSNAKTNEYPVDKPLAKEFRFNEKPEFDEPDVGTVYRAIISGPDAAAIGANQLHAYVIYIGPGDVEGQRKYQILKTLRPATYGSGQPDVWLDVAGEDIRTISDEHIVFFIDLPQPHSHRGGRISQKRMKRKARKTRRHRVSRRASRKRRA